MDDRYLEQTPNAAIDAWVATGASDALDYSKLKFPDLYGENDLPQVLAGAGQRAKGLPGKSGQAVVPKADHFCEGRDNELPEYARGFLDKSLRPASRLRRCPGDPAPTWAIRRVLPWRAI